MHKLRNTKHIKALDSLYGITPNFSNEPISKKKLRKLLAGNNWDVEKTRKEIESGSWIYAFIKDEDLL